MRLLLLAVASCASLATAVVLPAEPTDTRSEVRLGRHRKDVDLDEMLTGGPLTIFELNRAKRFNTYPELRQRIRDLRGSPRIWFLGDSTMRHQFQGFCFLVLDALVQPSGECRGEGEFANASAVFEFMPYFRPGLIGEGLFAASSEPPSLVFVGAALHLTHISPAFPWDVETYQHWLQYSTSLEELMQAVFKVAPRAKMALMLAQTVCESAFYGAFKEVVDATLRNATEAALPCVRDIAAAAVPFSQALQACQDSLRMRSGVMHMNEKMRAVYERHRKHPGVYLVDAFQFTEYWCDRQNEHKAFKLIDGIHCNTLVFDQLKLLFDTIGW